jgi:hypothetical protein
MNERPPLDAAEAAARLGVKRQTLYAYVSRGLLRSRPPANGRVSVFDATEVDALLRRSRAGRESAQELTIATAVSSIVDGELRYRGHLVPELARNAVRGGGGAAVDRRADDVGVDGQPGGAGGGGRRRPGDTGRCPTPGPHPAGHRRGGGDRPVAVRAGGGVGDGLRPIAGGGPGRGARGLRPPAPAASARPSGADDTAGVARPG